MYRDFVKLSLPNKAEYVPIARLTASVIANNHGFDIEEIEDIKVAVGEACNNVVLHSNYDYDFDIEFKINNSKFEIDIVDRGDGFDYTKYKEPEVADLKENGLGIFIIKTLMDEVNIDSTIENGTRIKMIKSRD